MFGSVLYKFFSGYAWRAEEEKRIMAVQKAIEEKGMLDHTIVHGVFVGPARSGKNSIMERLLGRMPSTVSPSTGVAESVVQVKVIQKSATFAANVEKSVWTAMDYDDEAIKLMVINSNKVLIPDISESVFEEPASVENSESESIVFETQSSIRRIVRCSTICRNRNRTSSDICSSSSKILCFSC